MKKILPLVLLLVVTGCATRPVPYRNAAPVASSNLLEGYSKYAQAREGTVRVIVVRDSGMLGAAVPAKLSIEGIPVAKLWPSQRLELFLTPNAYIFALEPSPRLGGPLVERGIELSRGKLYAFRITLNGGGSFSLEQSTQLQ